MPVGCRGHTRTHARVHAHTQLGSYRSPPTLVLGQHERREPRSQCACLSSFIAQSFIRLGLQQVSACVAGLWNPRNPTFLSPRFLFLVTFPVCWTSTAVVSIHAPCLIIIFTIIIQMIVQAAAFLISPRALFTHRNFARGHWHDGLMRFGRFKAAVVLQCDMWGGIMFSLCLA